MLKCRSIYSPLSSCASRMLSHESVTLNHDVIPNHDVIKSNDVTKRPVISFLQYISAHAAFVNRPTTPISRILTTKHTDYDYDQELGYYFLEMFQFYVKTERLAAAADLLRAVVCTELLRSPVNVALMKNQFLEILMEHFEKIDVLSYFDIALCWLDEVGYRQFCGSVVETLWKDEAKLKMIIANLSEKQNSAKLLLAFNNMLVRESLRLQDFSPIFSDLIDFTLVSRDTSFALMRVLVNIGEIDFAVSFVKENSVRNKGIVFGFYKKLKKNVDRVEPDIIRSFEEWMSDEGIVFKEELVTPEC